MKQNKNKVIEYIELQASPQKEICLALRKLILKTFPEVTEEMKWGVPVFFKGLFYIGPLKDHVNLGFAINGLSILVIQNGRQCLPNLKNKLK